MLTGYQLEYNGKANVACAKLVAVTGALSGLELTPIPCANEGGRLIGIDWAIPCSENGVTVTGYSFEKAVDNTKPRPDAIKTISVQTNSGGGSYGRWIVPDTYTTNDFVAACCAGCDPLPDVTMPAPIILNGECTKSVPTPVACVFQGDFYVPALTGGNTTFTATPYAEDVNGTPIAFSPATSAGTTVALLATDMTTNWATELGSGTFTVSANSILWTGTAAAKFSVTIVQS